MFQPARRCFPLARLHRLCVYAATTAAVAAAASLPLYGQRGRDFVQEKERVRERKRERERERERERRGSVSLKVSSDAYS